jgi:phosphate:Na+ symporter
MILMTIASVFIGDVLREKIGTVEVSIIHTVFNCALSIVMGLTYKLLIKVVMWIVPEDKNKQQKTAFLDERLLNTPSLAIDECFRLTSEMAEVSRTAIKKAIGVLENYNASVVEEIDELESLTDRYEDKLGTFLVRLSARNLSGKESHIIGRMLHTIGDLERIGDHAENISMVAKELREKNLSFSDQAKKEIKVIISAINEIVDLTTDSFVNNDIKTASLVEPLEQVIDTLRANIQERHIARVQKGDCTVELGFILTDMLGNFERVSDHCSNIAVYTVQLDSKKLDAHKYLRGLHAGQNPDFVSQFNEYEQKYSLPSGV